MTLAYPAGLPLPLRDGFAYDPVNQITRTEMQSGRARQRVAFTKVPSFLPLVWLFDQLQAQFFESWALQVAGAEWFTIRLQSPVGAQDLEVRFAESPRGPELIGLQHWRYTARVEVRERPQLAPEWVNFPAFVLGQSIIDQALNREWPQ